MMSSMHRTEAKTARNPMFVVLRGEDVATAMARHYRDYGVGPLLLVRDFNRLPERARGRRLRAA